MTDPALVLASASPRRRELLSELGLPFEIAAADIDEAALTSSLGPLAPERLALNLATAKAEAMGPAPNTVLLSADTVVAIDSRILGKPANAADAVAMLRLLRGREHTVATGIAVRAGGRLLTDVASARVTMRPYSDDEIARSVAGGVPMDKAGAYAIQDADFTPVERHDGCYCGVMGLPLWRTAALLRDAGLQPRPPGLARCAACPDARLLDTVTGRPV